MRFKLDECVDVRLTSLLEAAGHDAETVFSEEVAGATDRTIYDLCRREKRTLITQDMDFTNPFVFNPISTEGIVVLRNPSQLLTDLRVLMEETIAHLWTEKPAGHLWVVGKNGIRIWPA